MTDGRPFGGPSPYLFDTTAPVFDAPANPLALANVKVIHFGGDKFKDDGRLDFDIVRTAADGNDLGR
ncbi:hypothetical protein [Azospirillum canadense]|uniref:hypothetical protein n=1 Tax=Azospirillum canadense TaxID=403962 RepID=UPI002225EC3A|nr:hypothetical protein [Azospirillum canadense]MCW2240392.1 hypothetical protein [Azospirillum canadense]